MANGRNDPNNQFVKRDAQPWNKSKIEVEPSEDTPAEPRGRYRDRIRIPATTDEGGATKRSIKQWPEGLKRA